MTNLLVFISVFIPLLFIVLLAVVFVVDKVMTKLLVVVDALDGEIGEDDQLNIVEEFTLPSESSELEVFKQQIKHEHDQELIQFVVEDLKDGVLGNLKRPQ